MAAIAFEVITEMMCPDCEIGACETIIVKDILVYGVGEDAVNLPVTIPVRHCMDCGFEFTDYEAEEIWQDAIDSWLDTGTHQR